MKPTQAQRWWQKAGRPRLLATRTVRGAPVVLRYQHGLLAAVASEIRELAEALAPAKLPRPFTGQIRGRLAFAGGHVGLLAVDYVLNSTPLMNEAARRRLLTALGFETDEGRLLTSPEGVELHGFTLLPDDVETGRTTTPRRVEVSG